ncbi:hypothetical protein CUMW_003910 [Citrus unshiu]|nr:hypothetical protein CUMW_003910 [Citrus unshiu]
MVLGDLRHGEERRCKYVKPTPVQRHATSILVAGRDLMACAQTGSRKTTPFCFPIINGIMREHYSARKELRELARWVDNLMATLRRLVNLLERGRVSLQMIIRYLALKEAADQTLDMALNQKK